MRNSEASRSEVGRRLHKNSELGENTVKTVLSVLAVLLVFSATAETQSNPKATFVTGADIKAFTKSAAPRIVDTGGNYVGIGVQHRPKAEKGKAGNPLIHSNVTEVYIITEGSATLATGGTMAHPTIFPADGKDNGEGIGLGFTGAVENPSDVRVVVPGDIIIIPANCPHWFTVVPEDLTYLVIRIDPSKTIVLK